MPVSHLLVISDRVALAWVLGERRMAFPAYRAREVGAAQSGDELLLYTTRGAFHNPTRDRGRVMARALVSTPVRTLDEPIEVSGREFELGCELKLLSLAPVHEGVELAPLVQQLASFPNPRGWAMLLRRPLLTLTPEDAALLRDRLDALAGPPAKALPGYIAAAAVGRPPTG